MNDRLPEKILVSLPDGSKVEAVLLNWPVNGMPVYAITQEEVDKLLFVNRFKSQLPI